MYATIVPDHDRGDLTLACVDGAIIVGSRLQMDALPGTTVYLPDECDTIAATDLTETIPATPWDR